MTSARTRTRLQRVLLVASIVAAGFDCVGAGPPLVDSVAEDSGAEAVESGAGDSGVKAVESGVGDSGAEASVQSATGFIRVAQWSPDSPAVDLCLSPHGADAFTGPLLLNAFSSCDVAFPPAWCTSKTDAAVALSAGIPWPAFPQTSPYVRATAGQYDARFVAAGATDCSRRIAPDATNLPALVAEQATTIALVGSASTSNALELLAFSDDRTFPPGPVAGAVALRFIHAAPLLPAVDVGTGDIGDFQQLFLNVPFGTTGNTSEAIAEETGGGGDAGESWPPVVAPIPFVDGNGYQFLSQPLASAELSTHVPYAAKDIARAMNVSVGAGTVVTFVLTDPEPEAVGDAGAGEAAAGDAGAGDAAARSGLLVECIESMADAGALPPCAVLSVNSGAPSPDAGPEAGAPEAAANVTFTQVYTTIISPAGSPPGTCTACHAGVAPFGELDMSTQARAYSNLVGVMAMGSACGSTGEVRVVPGSSATSLVYHKVAGTQDCGVRMPYGGPYLNQAHIDLIKSWIDQGAPDN